MRTRKKPAAGDGLWHLRLYVAGGTARSIAAIDNLQKLCDEHLAGKYSIEVIDLIRNPALAAGDQILALPTLVRRLPPPMKKIIGDLSDSENVLVGLASNMSKSLLAVTFEGPFTDDLQPRRTPR